MRRTLWILLFLTVPVGAPHAKSVLSQELRLCVTGEFASGDGSTTVEIADGAIALDACPMTPANVKGSKKRTTLSARWDGCEGFKGAVRVAAKLRAGDCDHADVRV